MVASLSFLMSKPVMLVWRPWEARSILDWLLVVDRVVGASRGGSIGVVRGRSQHCEPVSAGRQAFWWWVEERFSVDQGSDER